MRYLLLALLLAGAACAQAQRPLAFETSSGAGVTVTTTTETVVCTLNGVFTPGPGLTVRQTGVLNFTVGASTTSLTVRLRRGTAVTGTLVGVAINFNVTASTTVQFPWALDDTPGEVANQSYVVTVQQAAATTNGTSNTCQMLALVF